MAASLFDPQFFLSKTTFFHILVLSLLYKDVGFPKNRKNQPIMIPRIKSFEPIDDWKLIVTFDDGFRVLYNVKDDIDTLEDFKTLTTELGLWPMAQLDTSRTCIFWNDRIDLPSDTIYEFGVPLA